MIEKDKVWIFLPAYNEASVISSVILRIKECGFRNIIVIDDGSTDNTFQCARQEGVFAFRLCINRGVGAAIQAAIFFAKRKNFDYLVLIDADGQHHPEDIQKLVEAMDSHQADMVIGSRFLEEKSFIPYSRILFNKLANWLTFLGRTAVSDSQSGFRMLNRKAIEQIELDLDSYAVCTEMIWKVHSLQLKLVEVAIGVSYTKYSMSKGQNLWRGIQTGISLVKKLIN